MRKIIILLLYIVFFWGVIPFILLGSSVYLDSLLAFEPYRLTAIGILVLIIAVPMLVLSIVQYVRQSGELPVSAYPPQAIFSRGIYNYLRHPIYLFYILVFIGIAMIRGSLSMLLIVMPVFIALNRVYVYVEEKQLIKRFGDAYRFYRKRTGIVIPVFWQMARYPVVLLMKILFGLTVKNRKLIPKTMPFFIVSEHKNYLDPFFIGAAFPFPLSYLSTYETYRNPGLPWFMDKLFCIPLRRYKKDFRSARLLEEAVHQGAVLGLFPEGERSWTGETQSFKPEVLKLMLRFSHIPIVPVRLDGNYFAWPRWSDSYKKHKVVVEVREAFYAPAGCTTDELEAEIKRRLQSTEEIQPVSSDAAISIHGIEKVLYRCRKCGALHSFEINENKLTCRQCGFGLSVMADYSLIPDDSETPLTIAQYYHSVKITPTDKLFEYTNRKKHDLEFANLSKCLVYVENKLNYDMLLEGLLSVGNGLLRIKNQEKELVVSFAGINSVTTEVNSKLHIYDKKEEQLYLVRFTEASVLMWQDILVSAIWLDEAKTINTR